MMNFAQIGALSGSNILSDTTYNEILTYGVIDENGIWIFDEVEYLNQDVTDSKVVSSIMYQSINYKI